MSEGTGDKKHPATARRRERARQEGKVSRSADLSSAVMLMIALLCLRWLGGPLCQRVAQGLSDSLSQGLATAWTFQDAMQQLLRAAALFALAALPILSVMFLAGIAVNVSQTGLLITPSAVAAKLKHISPLAGFKRIASIRGMMRLGFGIFKVLMIALVAYAAVRPRLTAIIAIWSEPVPVLARSLFENLFEVCIWIAGALLALGLVEYGFQRWRFEQDLRMTDEEMREEMKEMQVDPQMQKRRKELQTQLLKQPLTGLIAGADVVITAPAEVAIAISYQPAEMTAPVVIAKGAGSVAEQIRQLAGKYAVPIVERPALAQFLYTTTSVGGTIPADQYHAVAEVLRQVYQVTGKPLASAR
jgi:flagellar biosynthesis protein FlhB